MRLDAFQAAFAAALFQPPGADAAVSGATVSGATGVSLAALFAQPGFAVYRNTVVKGCIDALQANYPAVARLVGDEWFRAAAAIYVRERPPREPMLLAYGDGFADWLDRFEPAAGLPYLSAVARIDRFWTEAHGAADEAPVAAQAVAGTSPEQLPGARLRPHASARWAWFGNVPALSIWTANRTAPGDPRSADLADRGDGADEADGADGASPPPAPLEWRGEGALVVRSGQRVEAVALGRADVAFLDACAAGGTLADAVESALHADRAADFSDLMRRLLVAGAFGGLRVPDAPDAPDAPDDRPDKEHRP